MAKDVTSAPSALQIASTLVPVDKNDANLPRSVSTRCSVKYNPGRKYKLN